MGDWNNSNLITTNDHIDFAAEDIPLDRGQDLLRMPTLASRRLGTERLREARRAGERRAACVLGMFATGDPDNESAWPDADRGGT